MLYKLLSLFVFVSLFVACGDSGISTKNDLGETLIPLHKNNFWDYYYNNENDERVKERVIVKEVFEAEVNAFDGENYNAKIYHLGTEEGESVCLPNCYLIYRDKKVLWLTKNPDNGKYYEPDPASAFFNTPKGGYGSKDGQHTYRWELVCQIVVNVLQYNNCWSMTHTNRQGSGDYYLFKPGLGIIRYNNYDNSPGARPSFEIGLYDVN